MSQETEVTRLEMRIAQLEDELKQFRAARQPVDINAEEVKAYLKVRELLHVADWGDFCGINDCQRCIVFRCSRCIVQTCARCIVECTCGPCNVCGVYGGGLAGGGSRFGGLGE